MIDAGTLGSRVPVSSPTIASPRICCHQLSVVPVVHDEVTVAEEAADAEGVDGVAHAAFEDDGGVAEGAEGDDDGLSADDVVDDLVPGHDLEGVGTGVVADLEGDHGLPVGEPVGVVGHGCELGVVDGRDAVSNLA